MDRRNDRASITAKEDRISNLPDDIIHRILSFLDMRYAVQTSALSQRWKLIWTSMPHLKLSSREFDTLRKFARFVKHVLSHRDNLAEVSAVELFFTGAATQFFVRSIINYACSHNVKSMIITYFPKKCPELPLRLFTHQTLKHLTLRAGDVYFRGNCSIPKSAWDFPALETLHLSYITFCENTDKSLDLFSKCVNLRNLTLHEFIMLGLEVFNICAPELSNLTIIDGFRHPKVFNVVAPQLRNLTASVYDCKYVVFAPCVSSLTCKGSGPLELSTDRFHSLEKVDLSLSINNYNKEKDVSILLDLLQKLGSAKFLTLNVDIVEALSSCLDQLSHEPCPFDNLKYLRIDALQSERDHKATISTQVRNYFLENSPHATFIMDLPVEQPKKSRKRVRKEAMAEKTAEEKALLDVMAKLEAMLNAKRLELANLKLLITTNKIKELLVQIKRGAPNYENILSMACQVRSMMNDLSEGDRIYMEAQLVFQYEALKPMLDNSSQWKKIKKALFDKDMPTSSSGASTSGSKSAVQPSQNSLG